MAAMRSPMLLALLVLAVGPVVTVEATRDGTIVKVITLLKEMLDKSKDDGNQDREIFAKFKCYCDENTDEKTESIATLTKQIKLLGSEIAELQADTAKRSQENAELKPMKEDNERSRSTAESIRGKESSNFVAEESDLKAAVTQMDNAIEELSKVGADQTAAASSDESLIRIKQSVKAAVKAASFFAGPKQRKALAAFIQAPFTGSYSAQSGEIVGILKNMRDNFKTNLEASRKTEEATAQTDGELLKTKQANYDEMQATYEDNESVMGSNDGDLSSKKAAKAEAETSLSDDSLFLAKLKKMCKDTQFQYETRKMIRANEEAAVQQAISILNSDAAADSFKKSKSTKDGAVRSFVQVGHSSKSRSRVELGDAKRRVRASVKDRLAHAAKKLHSARIAKIMVMLQEGNPFDKVVDEIDEMVAVINREEKADDSQKAWCDTEREESHDSKASKKSKVDTIKSDIDDLDDTVNNGDTGLKAMVGESEGELKTNRKDQQAEIDNRSDDNKLYQEEITNLNTAFSMLETAKKTLNKFYDWLDKAMGPHHYDKKEGRDSGGGNLKEMKGASVEELEAACSADAACVGFNTAGYLKKKVKDEGDWFATQESLYVKVYDESLLQKKKKEDPAPPSTWNDEGKTGGQKEKGRTVITMLDQIMTEVEEEIAATHKGEEASQHEFESDMDTLKQQETDLMGRIQSLEQEITEKEADIEAKHEDREKTELEHKNIERYIKKIKPGCDFITENIDERKENRAAEKTSLNAALDDLKATPAYKEAAAAAETAALGECADRCQPQDKRETVECKACVAGVSVAGYCAANADQAGC